MSLEKKPQIIFRPENSGLHKFYGKLEAELLEIIWENGPMTVKRALFFAGHKQKYAYTTVMTVMNHLVNKGILTREKVSHSFLYSPVMTRDDFLNLAVDKIISGLTLDYGPITMPILSRYVKPVRKPKNSKS
jgi:predicted transcriptional regulator